MTLGSWPIRRPPSLSRWFAREPAYRPLRPAPCPASSARRRLLRGRLRRSAPRATRAGRSPARGSGTRSALRPPRARRRRRRRAFRSRGRPSAPSGPSPPWRARSPAARAATGPSSGRGRRRPAAARGALLRSRSGSPSLPLGRQRVVRGRRAVPGRADVAAAGDLRQIAASVVLPVPTVRAVRAGRAVAGGTAVGVVALLRRRLQEPRRRHADDQAGRGGHSRPPAREVLDLAQEVVAAVLFQVRPDTLDLVRGTIRDARRLRVAVLLQLIGAAAKRLRDRPRLRPRVRRPLVELLREAALALARQLARLLLRRRRSVLHLRRRLADDALVLHAWSGRAAHQTPFRDCLEGWSSHLAREETPERDRAAPGSQRWRRGASRCARRRVGCHGPRALIVPARKSAEE